MPERANSKVFVAGHRGLVGSAVVRRLEQDGITPLTATRDELDLRNQSAVNEWFRANRPETVYLVAGTVGGILANSTRPAEFIYDNLMIHATVVHACHLYGTRKLLYLGSSCIYPREAAQPMTEGRAARRPARADQRILCGGEDCGDQTLSGLSPSVRPELHFGDADEPVRAERQFRSEQLACAAGADAQVSRCQAVRRNARSLSGEADVLAVSSFTSTTWRRRVCS